MTSMEMTTPPVRQVPAQEALPLLRRAAGARGLAWPAGGRGVTGVGGFTGNFTQLPGDERVVWATLPEQEGLLALFQGDRLLATADKRLAHITAVQPLSLPLLPHLALMVDDRYDNLIGAYQTASHRRIYVWDGRNLRQVYEGELASEQYRHAKWTNPRAADLWRLHRVTATIVPRGMSLVESRKEEELEAPGSAQAPIPPASAFRLIDQRTVERTFRWDPRLRRYDPA